MMKVLVLGATGMTGQHAVRLLLKRGDQVTAFARTPRRKNLCCASCATMPELPTP